MSKRKQLAQDIGEVKQAMKNSVTKDEYRRLQCIYLADTRPELTLKDISEMTLYSKSMIDKIHSSFRKKGICSVKDKRGGRFRENMTLEEEGELLSQFEELSQSGKLVVAGKLKLAYEEKVGKQVSESTIYRMLSRHGFRKIVPYKRHPKSNIEEQESFKKTFPK